jgi:hypothetical protein
MFSSSSFGFFSLLAISGEKKEKEIAALNVQRIQREKISFSKQKEKEKENCIVYNTMRVLNEKIRSDNNLKDGEKIKIKNLKDKYLKLLYLSRNYHSRINLIMKLKYELEELFASSSSCFSEKDRSLKIDISCLMRDVEQKV